MLRILFVGTSQYVSVLFLKILGGKIKNKKKINKIKIKDIQKGTDKKYRNAKRGINNDRNGTSSLTKTKTKWYRRAD